MAKNPRTQEVQAVLHIMGFPLGASGVDGDRGPITTQAMMSATGMGNIADMEEALLKKMKDPEWRAAALEKLRSQPPNKDNVIAQQWLLKESGTDRFGMKDPVTGMMNGIMNEATQISLSQTSGGRPNASAYAAYGIPESATQLALNGGKLNGAFSNAVAARSNEATPVVSAAPKPSTKIEFGNT